MILEGIVKKELRWILFSPSEDIELGNLHSPSLRPSHSATRLKCKDGTMDKIFTELYRELKNGVET